MQSTPKIMVLQLKEVIYTVIFVILGILLVLLLIFMFLPDKKEDKGEESGTYNAGTYSASLILNSVPMEVSVCVDENYIKSVELVNLSDSVAAMYPLLQPSLEDIESFLVANQSLENIYFEMDNEYTGTVLAEAVKTALGKAER